MLVLSRHEKTSICIGDNIKVMFVRLDNRGRAVLGITAPDDVAVHREEVYERIQRENSDALQACERASGEHDTTANGAENCKSGAD